MDALRVGLVGFGRFGKIHASAIAKLANVSVTSICVGSEESVAESKKQLDVPVYSDYDNFLSQGGFDIVDIVSPNYLHASQAISAMEKGMDVILEKPIAINIEDALRMSEVQKRTSAKVQVVFEYRYVPLWKAFKSALSEGLVTDPTFAKIESWRGPFRTGSRGWRYDRARVGHQLLEEAIHYFDLALWYFGMPQKVSGFTDSPSTWKDGKFSTAVITLEYANGLKVLIEDTLNGVAGQNVVSASGQGAMIGMMYSGIESPEETAWIRIREKDGGYRAEVLKTIDEVDGISLLLEDFISRLRKGEEPSVSLSDGFKALSLDLSAISAVHSDVPEIPKTV
ncbi:MAG TPA: Gfo/Idh/MocA family oxidoreductase [Nitrososphaerales archaeon]|nr:Gfo/Idh/MocA family oxidoreductase [Nitrososphaerales archaeon]